MKTMVFEILTFLLCAVSTALAQDSLGCFISSIGQPDLPNLIHKSTNTPKECAEECRQRYFMYAGLMYGEQCYCGSHYGKNGPSNDCTVPCSMDKDNFCGSQTAISVYASGQKGPSPPRRLRVTDSKPTSVSVAWSPPDLPNGNLTSYILRTFALVTHASMPLSPGQTIIQGGESNSTILISLHPGTKYNVTVSALNTQSESDPASIIAWTLLGPPEKPQVPKVIDKTSSTKTIIIPKGRSENGPITSYQIVVVERFIIPPTDQLYPNYHLAVKDSLGYYTTAEFESSDFDKYEKFIVGDDKSYGGYYNAPLKGRFADGKIGVVLVSRVDKDVQFSYSNLGNSRSLSHSSSQVDSTIIGLCVAIAILGALLVASVLAYFVLRQRHTQNRMRKLPEQQELTLQGPVYEVDNMAYIPDDVPERANHYQNLKEKVWSIPKNFLTIDAEVIRRGRFGNVLMGTVQKNGITSTAAVHCITDMALRPTEKKHMLRDLDVCIKAGAMKNLAGLVGTCETPEILYIVLEMPPQTLKNRLLEARSGEAFPFDRILTIGAAIAGALKHLEGLKIVHSLLCARSVGLCQDFTPKVMGFGIGKYAIEDIKYARWTAVECFSKQKKSPQGVVWAFGILVWEMLSMGGTPYANLPTDIDVEEAVDQGVRLPQLQDTPDPLYEVLMSCWQTETDERPTFDELVRLNTLSLCPITAITEPYIAEMELN